jgi:TetR/AcrR family transcriptional repressor of nem operon
MGCHARTHVANGTMQTIPGDFNCRIAALGRSQNIVIDQSFQIRYKILVVGRPRQFDKERALSAATELFWLHGYESASIAMLLSEMEINRQSAYGAFGDKRSLFLQALQTYAARVGGTIRQGLSDRTISPLARVRRFLQSLGDMCQVTDGKGCLITNTIVEVGPHDAEVRDLVTMMMRNAERWLCEALREAIETGELPATADPKRLARFLLTIMQGALVLSKTGLDHSVVRDALITAEEALS